MKIHAGEYHNDDCKFPTNDQAVCNCPKNLKSIKMNKITTKSLKWHNEKRKVSDLIPFEKNPRKITDKQKEELKASLEKFDLVEVPAINTDNKICAGHQRVAIMHLLGRGKEEIDVRVPNRKLTKAEFEEYNLRSNKNTADWDLDILKEFDVEKLLEVGFGEDELGQMWDDMTEIEEDGFNVQKALDEIKTPKTKPGDLYQLGSHRLLCGDSTKEQDVEKLMNGEFADMIFCDPPYNIGLDYSRGTDASKTKVKYSNNKQNDSKEINEYLEFLNTTIKNILKFSKPNLHIFYWCDEKYIWLLQTLFKENEIRNERICLWVKNNFYPRPQTAFNKVYEPCVYGTMGKPYLNKDHKNLNEILNREVESGNQVIDEIMDIINIWLVKRDNTQDYVHPTQKPLSLNQKSIKRCTKPNDIIVDLFGGSGSTLLATEQLKRRCYMIEIEPIFCDVIIKRWEEFTNQKAKLIR